MKLFLPTLILIFTCRPAHAYIDPGSGALIWQLIVAFFLGGIFYIRKVITFLIRYSNRKDKKTKTETKNGRKAA